MSAMVHQHTRSSVVFDPPATWISVAREPGIAAPKFWVCRGCHVSLVTRSKPVCVGCGRRMEIGKP